MKFLEWLFGSKEEWRDVKVESEKGSGWVFLPRAPDVKLVTINDEPAQKEAREVLAKAIIANEPFTLTAEREPENPFDKNAVAVFVETPNQPKSKAGYFERDLAEMLRDRYETDMPISAVVHRMRSTGTRHFISVRLLVPTAKRRAPFELQND